MPDPDLEIRVGGRSFRPLDKGGGRRSPQKNFSALRASVWSKNKGGGGGGGGGGRGSTTAPVNPTGPGTHPKTGYRK